ncbi:MAG: hypothetical protein WED82_02110 [Balneolales bacterium]
MSKYEIKGVVREKEIPKSTGGGGNLHEYNELFDKYERIPAGSSVHLQVTQKHYVANIKNAFNRKYGKNQALVVQRADKDQEGVLNVYIIRK